MFLLALTISVCYLIIGIIIDITWIQEISVVFGSVFSIYMVTFVALVPGFMFIFVLLGLALNKDKQDPVNNIQPDVTVLIPGYNASETILDTVESLLKQKYNGKIFIKVIDDGSDDGMANVVKSSALINDIELIELEHHGKSYALNYALKTVTTEYMLTVDSDTDLNEFAIGKIVEKIQNTEKYVAVAGCLFVKNDKQTFITRLQQWDYTIGIFGTKLLQSYYNSVLVAQGAFSIYKTDLVKELNGWRDTVGEDIVLTWELLDQGYKTGFAKDAIGFTSAPETFMKLGKQRKRWARGMIEAFKEVGHILISKASFKTKFLVFLNLFFPFTDIAILIFVPLMLAFLLLGHQLLVSRLIFILIPLGLSLCGIIELKRHKALKQLGVKIKKRDKLAFLVYVILYSLILAPFCITGYLSELFNLKKRW